MNRITPFFALLAPLALAACGSLGNPIERIEPYRLEIQQGNAVTQEMLAQLRPGMTPAQVRFVLGTPLIVDPFRENRWDYVYLSGRSGGLVRERRRITVVFEDGRLKGVEGDVAAAPSRPMRAGAGDGEAK